MSKFPVTYMDYAASTPVDPAVLDIMQAVWQAAGNASSVQNLHGAQARKRLRMRVRGWRTQLAQNHRRFFLHRVQLRQITLLC